MSTDEFEKKPFDWTLAAPWIYAAAMFAIWEASCWLFAIPQFVLPAPSRIAVATMAVLAGDLDQLAADACGPHWSGSALPSSAASRSASSSAGRRTSTPGSTR